MLSVMSCNGCWCHRTVRTALLAAIGAVTRGLLPAAAASILAAAVQPAGAQGLDAAALHRLVESQMRLSMLPAVAVAVVRPDREVFVGGFGPAGAAVGPDTPFLIGSVSKTITALAIAQLADAGRLRFDDPVVVHLPGFALDAPQRGRAITLRQLLTHTSGLRTWSGHDRAAQQEAKFDHIAPARAPGGGFEYSSLNYIVLGRVIEAVSGMRYADYLREHVFVPLEMKNSFSDLAQARSAGLVRGHRFLYGWPLPWDEAAQPEPLVPAGFLVSSARDLGHFLEMLLGEGRFRGRQIVSPAVLKEMFVPWDGAASGPAMAWGVGRTRAGHAGATPTFSARLSLLHQQQAGVVVLANVNSGPFFAGIAAVEEGVLRLLRSEAAGAGPPYEILFKLTLLALLATGFVRMLTSLRRWARRGFPRELRWSRRTVAPLAGELAIAAAVLIGVPRWVGVPLPTLLVYFPDLGLAMVIGAATGVAAAAMRSFAAAADAAAPTRRPPDPPAPPR